MAIPPRKIFRINPADEDDRIAVGIDLPLRDVNDLNSVQGTGEIWVDINNEDLKVCEC